jgi:hypothetical protein
MQGEHARLVLARVAALKSEDGVQVLRANLMFAVKHGPQAPKDRNGNALDAIAARLLALLFGREEMGDDNAVAIPATVIASVIGTVLVLGRLCLLVEFYRILHIRSLQLIFQSRLL